MKYVEGGNLRQYLQKNYSKLRFKDKIDQLYQIALGLNSIHKQGLVHRDFHSGNILNKEDIIHNILCYITDLGLCQPVNEIKDEKKVFGVLPYVAPEVLQGQSYTQAGDIYSFGMVAYEVLSGLPPYYNLAHDEKLIQDVTKVQQQIESNITQEIKPLRPDLKDIKAPQLLKVLIEQC